jgi:RHS repeat-associated protein
MGQKRWEYPTDNPIAHGTNNDQNIIVLVTYDKAGRMTNLRDPRGNLTSYAYDQLNRRKTLTNPLSQAWTTAYENLVTGGTRTTMTYPNGGTHQVQREFDRLGRLKSIQYLNESPKNTPDVKFTYTIAGSRTAMSEYTGAGFTNRVRETQYGYDDVRRLTSVGFDNDGSGTVDQTVSYEYDAGGLRTKLTLPGSLNVTYTYDAKGRLVSLSDWDSQTTAFAHDNANRLQSSVRANGLRCRYFYDAASRLRWLRHTKDQRTLAHFAYEVDKRGNRTRAVEMLARPATTADLTIAYNDVGIATKGTWSNSAPFKVTTDTSASLQFLFMTNLSAATQPQFTFGIGPDHGIFDVYVGGTLWQSFDGYAASASTRTVSLNLSEEGPLSFEIRARKEKNLASSGYQVRFQQLLLTDVAYDLHTIAYQYDLLSRLLGADDVPGSNLTATPTRAYDYTYDGTGNRLSQSLSLNGAAPTVTSYTYNAANQITSGSLTYDNNGNLTSDGTNTYVWDRANRLLSMGGASYAYDAMSNRVKQTVGANVTQYLLDLQPGLSVVLAETQGANTTRYVQGPMGIHAHKDSANNWEWMIQDGLGSVRGVVDNSVAVLESRLYELYGVPFGATGTSQTSYGFTGEPTDSSGLLHLRARYYAPNLGVFLSLDPFEGITQRPMSLNGYSWVEGNTPNKLDPSGETCSESYTQLVNGPEGDRRRACVNLAGILPFRAPRFEELASCYYCAADASFVEDRAGRTSAYNAMLNAAVDDGMLHRYLALEYKQWFTISDELPPPGYNQIGLSLPEQLNISDGYAEGISVDAGANGLSATGGIEIVYNLATFQRAWFHYGGVSFNLRQRNASQPESSTPRLQPGGSLSTYVAYIGGFTPIQFSQSQPSDPFGHFVDQYRGPFENRSIGGGLPFLPGSLIGLGGGATHFSSPDGSVFGVAVALSLTSPGIFVGGSQTVYERTGAYEKNYVDYTCRVDTNQLETDIMNGDWSPIRVFTNDVFSTLQGPLGARATIAQIARRKAEAHNYGVSVGTIPCGC